MRCFECGHIQGVEVLGACDNCNNSDWFIDYPDPLPWTYQGLFSIPVFFYQKLLGFFSDGRVIRCRSCGDYFDSVLCGKCEAWICQKEEFVGGEGYMPVGPSFVPPCTECGKSIGGPWIDQACLHCGAIASGENRKNQIKINRRINGDYGDGDYPTSEDKRSKFNILTILAYGFIALNVLGGLLMLLGFLFYR